MLHAGKYETEHLELARSCSQDSLIVIDIGLGAAAVFTLESSPR